MMNDLTKGNQCRKRIADNRQAHRAEPLTWQYSELKGQRPNPAPRFRTGSESSRQCTRYEDWDRKCSVIAVAGRDRSGDGLGIDTARGTTKITFGAVDRLAVLPAFIRRAKGGSCSCPCHPSRRRDWRGAQSSPTREE